jgi:hypothetical protein
MMVTHEKTWSYAKWVPRDDFIPLVIDKYECFHSHFDSLLIVCAQTTIVVINIFFNPLDAYFLL